jgi:hypothetical protein
MPVKIYKTDIRKLEFPEIDYLIMGFDSEGYLVKIDEEGNYDRIIKESSNDELNISIITLGNRIISSINGLYSISQGTNNKAEGISSFAAGNYSFAMDDMSYSRGQYVNALGYLSTVIGKGVDENFPLTAYGENSFVVQNCEGGLPITYGSFSDFSAILGGRYHIINSNSNNSVIFGGENNTITSSVNNTVIIGSNNINAINSNSAYVQRLVLKNNNTQSIVGEENGMLLYNSNLQKIQVYINGNWKNFNDYEYSGVTLNTTQIITAQKTFSNNLLLTNLSEIATSNVVYINTSNGSLSYSPLPAGSSWETIDGDDHVNIMITSRIGPGFDIANILIFNEDCSLAINTKWLVSLEIDGSGQKSITASRKIGDSVSSSNIPTFNNVLFKTNTEPYTPTANYHPATYLYTNSILDRIAKVASFNFSNFAPDDALFTVNLGMTILTNYNVIPIIRSRDLDWNNNNDNIVTIITKQSTYFSFAIRKYPNKTINCAIDYFVVKS